MRMPRIPANFRMPYIKRAIKNGMKVLTYDIETSHMLVRTFYIGSKVHLNHKQVKVPSKVITIQYKWAHEKQAKYLMWDTVKAEKHDDARAFDDSSMIEEFNSTILAKADILITQNGDRFDYVILNERAKALQLAILEQKPSLDILKLSRKSFRAASHKLDYRSAQQGLGGKITMVDDDWTGIEERGVSPKKKMVPYGLKDVVDTEKLLWKELPYYKDIPVGVKTVIYSYLNTSEDGATVKRKEIDYCIKCKSEDKVKSGFALTAVGKKQKYQCKDCGYRWRT